MMSKSDSHQNLQKQSEIRDHEARVQTNSPSKTDSAISGDRVAETQTLALSATQEDDSASSAAASAGTDEESKGTIIFGNLGPLIINKDGTLSRIRNWDQMTEAERQRTVRVLGKRNMLRKEAIIQADNPVEET